MVSGDVQQAGYRNKMVEFGTSLGLTGYAENLPDGRVKVVAEGEERKLAILKEVANIKNALIDVEKIESSFSEATGEFSGFFKHVKEGETDERLDKAAELLKEVIVTMKQGFNRLGDGQDKMLEKQDKMLEKQDSLIRITERGFTDMKTGFVEVREEIHSVRDDFREMFMHEVSELRGEIAEVKATLARMQAAG